MRTLGVMGLAAWLALPALAQDEALQLNPFNDPFVQATSARNCPAPRGPAYTETQRRQEAHYRVERGTSCWLAGTCSEPNAYRYDQRLADAVVQALRADAALADSAIWVIAERRFIYLQGCVATTAQAAQAEALAKAVPDVQIVIPALSLPGETARYPLAAPQSRRTTPRTPRSPSHRA
jgi:BON domain